MAAPYSNNSSNSNSNRNSNINGHHAYIDFHSSAMSEVDNSAPRVLPAMMMAHYRSSITTQLGQNEHVVQHHPSLEPARMTWPAPVHLTLDDYNLISLGYKPVLPRNLHWRTLVGITISSTNVLCGIIAIYGIPLTSGGPAWATWSFLGIGLMSLVVSLCLAELVSAYPTAAGVHHWVYQLGSLEHRPFLTYLVGWMTIAGSVATASSGSFYFSSILGQVLLSIHKVEHSPGTLVMFHLGVLSLWQLINLLPTRGLGHMSTMSAIFAVIVAASLIALLLINTPIQTNHVLAPFTMVLNYSGSSSAVYASLSSCLMAAFVFCPQDNVIRLSEESYHPERSMPWMLIGSTVFSLIVGFPLVIVLNYASLVPIQGLLDEPVPAVRVILTVLGRHIGVIFVSCLLFVSFFTGMNRLSMACRVAYAFARDGGLAKSSHWNHLHKRRRAPERVSWLVTAACMSGIFPYYWGNINAFHWIANLACVASNLSFVVPLWIRLTPEGASNHVPGPFALNPRLSRLLHIISIVWLLFLSIVLMFPSSIPLQARDFNYAPVAMASIFLLAVTSWWCKAKYDFTGGAMEKSRAVHHRTPDHFSDTHDGPPSRRYSPSFLGSPRSPPPHPRGTMTTPLTTLSAMSSTSDSGKIPTGSLPSHRHGYQHGDPSMSLGQYSPSGLPTYGSSHGPLQSPCPGIVGNNGREAVSDNYFFSQARSMSAITIPSYLSYESLDNPGIPLSDSSEIVSRGPGGGSGGRGGGSIGKSGDSNFGTNSPFGSPSSIQSSGREHEQESRGNVPRISTNRFLAPSPDSLLMGYSGGIRCIPEIKIAPPTTVSSQSSRGTPTTTSDIHIMPYDEQDDRMGDLAGSRRPSSYRLDPGEENTPPRLTRTNTSSSNTNSACSNSSHRPITATESLFPSGVNKNGNPAQLETLQASWNRSSTHVGAVDTTSQSGHHESIGHGIKTPPLTAKLKPPPSWWLTTGVGMHHDMRGNRRPPTPFPFLSSDTSEDEVETEEGQRFNKSLSNPLPLGSTRSTYPSPYHGSLDRQHGHFSGPGWVKELNGSDAFEGALQDDPRDEWYDLDINGDVSGSELPAGNMDPYLDKDRKNSSDRYLFKNKEEELSGGPSSLMDVDESFDEQYNHQYPVISLHQSSHDLFKLPTKPTVHSASPPKTSAKIVPRSSRMNRYFSNRRRM